MSSWKRVVFPLIAAVVVVAAMTAMQMPQVRASFFGAGQSSPNSATAMSLPPEPPGAATDPQAQAQDQKPFIGIFLVNNSAQVKDRLGLSTDQGVVIARVAKDSPGAKAGLKDKDIISAVDGTAVKTAQDVTGAVRAKKVGDTVTLSITRGSQPSQDIKVTLAAAPGRPAAPKGAGPRGGPGGFLGPNPGQNLKSAKIEITDKDGKTRTIEIVNGTVQSASSSGISVVPNGDSAARTFQVTQDTRVGLRGKIEDLKQGDRVIVVAEGGNALRISGGDAMRRGFQGMPFQGMPFHRPGLRGGNQQPAPRAPGASGTSF